MTESCGATHCVTCADEALPMRVEQTADGIALCRSGDGEPPMTVMTDLVGPLTPGDVVLVHAGTALSLVESPESVR